MKPFPSDALENLLPPISSYTYVPEVAYEYFENSKQHPFQAGAWDFQMVNAWWLADAAMLAYSDQPVIEQWCLKAGFKSVEWFSAKSTQCYIAVRDEYVFVVFRGTQAPGKGQSLRDVFTDWGLDFQVQLTEFEGNGFVHRGFKEGLDQVWNSETVSAYRAGVSERLEAVKRDNPNATIWFTGHSLGAALATLAAARYVRHGGEARLYTFGSPMVGDRAFQRSFEMAAWRFVNNLDIITRLPRVGRYIPFRRWFAGRYHSVGELKFIDQNGNIGPTEITPRKRLFLLSYLWTKYRQSFDKLADHAPLRYTLRIWNAYSSGGAAAPPAVPQTEASSGRRFGFPFKSIAALAMILLAIGLWYWFWPPKEEHKPAHAVIIENGLGADREEFYSLAEGSEMFPLAMAEAAWVEGSPPEPGSWFAASFLDPVRPLITRPKRFLDNLERFGFIPVPKTEGNPLGYIGLTVAQREGTGLEMAGVNCAACHVGQIEYKGQAIRIDGAPNMLDIFGFIFALRDTVGKMNLPVLFLELEISWKDVTYEGLKVYKDQLDKLGKMNVGTIPHFGRADAFGTARSMFFNDFRPMTAPASFPHIWGFEKTAWYHWNANTNSVIERNVGQSLGLGAGIDPKDCETTIRFEALDRMERLGYKITAPSWPPELGAIDTAARDLGEKIYLGSEPYSAIKKGGCVRCHDNYETVKDGNVMLNDYRLFSLNAVGTDPNEALNFTPSVMVNSAVCRGNDGDNEWKSFGEAHEILLAGVRVDTTVGTLSDLNQPFNGGRGKPEWRITALCGNDSRNCPVYPAKPLPGIWATAPYLHNGSVPTIFDLLTPPQDRPKTFKVGQRKYDPRKLGYAQENLPHGNYAVFDTSEDGNRNTGHEYGTELSTDEKYALIEYLKSLAEGDQERLRQRFRTR